MDMQPMPCVKLIKQFEKQRLDLVFWLSFNMGCDFVRIFLDLWSVSQGSFALEFEMEFQWKNSIEFNTKCLIQHID